MSKQAKTTDASKKDWRCSICGGGDIHAFHCPKNQGGYRTTLKS